MEEIKAKIRNFLRRFYRQRDLLDDENIFEVGFANSLFLMQLVIFIGNNFNFEVANDDLNMKNFCTIDSICQYILSKSDEYPEVNLN